MLSPKHVMVWANKRHASILDGNKLLEMPLQCVPPNGVGVNTHPIVLQAWGPFSYQEHHCAALRFMNNHELQLPENIHVHGGG
jgi:hypothetical protein